MSLLSAKIHINTYKNSLTPPPYIYIYVYICVYIYVRKNTYKNSLTIA